MSVIWLAQEIWKFKTHASALILEKKGVLSLFLAYFSEVLCGSILDWANNHYARSLACSLSNNKYALSLEMGTSLKRAL